MEMSEKKKTPLSDLMDASLAKIREMVDSNTVVGQPITTPDGVTLIPVSRLSFGFGAGGSDYGKQPTPNFGGGAGAGRSTPWPSSSSRTASRASCPWPCPP